MSAWSAMAGAAFDRPQPPPDRDTARVAALELQARGLTPRDISEALKLSESAVHDLFEELHHHA